MQLHFVFNKKLTTSLIEVMMTLDIFMDQLNHLIIPILALPMNAIKIALSSIIKLKSLVMNNKKRAYNLKMKITPKSITVRGRILGKD